MEEQRKRDYNKQRYASISLDKKRKRIQSVVASRKRRKDSAIIEVACMTSTSTSTDKMNPTGIQNLSLYQRKWSIKVMLLEKDPIKNFKLGEGRLQKMILLNKEGLKIHAVMFNEIVDKFNDILIVGKIYIISNGLIRLINKNFYNVHDKFEIILNNLSEINECEHDTNFVPQKILSTIEKIRANPNSPSDILLLVVNVGDLRTVIRHRDNKKIVKRDLQVFALRSEKIILTLWESLATVEGQQIKEITEQFSIILAKAIVGKFFNDFSLSTTTSTIIEINPCLSESKEIRDWFIENKLETDIYKDQGVSFTDLSVINSIEHCSGEIKFYNIKVFMKALKQEGNLWYNACDVCKSKVIMNEGLFECIKCSKKDVEYHLRYIIKIDIEDKTSLSTMTLFDHDAERIIGIPAEQLKKLKETNYDEYIKVIASIIGREDIFTIRTQDKLFGNRLIRTLTATSNNEDLNFVRGKKIKLEEA